MNVGLSSQQWLLAALVAQAVVTLFFVAQLVTFLRAGWIVPLPAIILGLWVIIVVLVYAMMTSQWLLAMSETANIAAGLQLVIWRRHARATTPPARRPGFPVVAPHTADPKSGVVPAPPRSGIHPPLK